MGTMRLSEYMEITGLTDSAMAARLGDCAGATAVRKWRLGQRFPRLNALERIQEVTDGRVTAADLAEACHEYLAHSVAVA